MGNTLFRFRAILIGTAVAASCTNADAWIVHDPSHTAQTVAAEAARAADAAREIQTQLSMYQNMVRNAISLGDPIFKPLGNTLRSLYSVYMQGQSLAYRLENIDHEFSIMNPGYYSYLGTMGQGTETFPQKYRAWSERSNESIRSALVSSGMQVDEMENEQQMLEALVNQSQTAAGRMQAIQAGNQLAAMQVQQTQLLRKLAYDNIRMQAEYMAIERDRRALDDAVTSRWRSAPPTNSPGQEF